MAVHLAPQTSVLSYSLSFFSLDGRKKYERAFDLFLRCLMTLILQYRERLRGKIKRRGEIDHFYKFLVDL